MVQSQVKNLKYSKVHPDTESGDKIRVKGIAVQILDNRQLYDGFKDKFLGDILQARIQKPCCATRVMI